MSAFLTKRFWTETLERAVKSAAQFALAAVGQDVVGADMFAADWKSVGASALVGLVFSALTSLATANVGPQGSPSAV